MSRDRLRQRVYAELDPILDGQIAAAKGLKYLVLRDQKTGKFSKITADEAAKVESEGRLVIEVWDKEPNAQAAKNLLDQTMDRAKEHIEAVLSGNLNITQRLVAGRKRVFDARNK